MVFQHNHTIVELGRHLWRSPVQPLCSSTATYSQIPRTTSRWLWSTFKGGGSTAPTDNLCQCSVTLTVSISSLMFRGSSLYFSLFPLPLFLSLDFTEKRLAMSSLYPLFSDTFINWQVVSEPSLLWAEQSQVSVSSHRRVVLVFK